MGICGKQAQFLDNSSQSAFINSCHALMKLEITAQKSSESSNSKTPDLLPHRFWLSKALVRVLCRINAIRTSSSHSFTNQNNVNNQQDDNQSADRAPIETNQKKTGAADNMAAALSAVSEKKSGQSERILVIKLSPDHAQQYLPLMDAAFCAQRMRVPIDVCVLEETFSATPFGNCVSAVQNDEIDEVAALHNHNQQQNEEFVDNLAAVASAATDRETRDGETESSATAQLNTTSDSNLLKQVVQLTCGIYFVCSKQSIQATPLQQHFQSQSSADYVMNVHLLQTLITVFSAEAFLRAPNCLVLPDIRHSAQSCVTSAGTAASSSSNCAAGGGGDDFRPGCFCHRTPIDIGRVCSVCLSVFCQFRPACTTCGSQFKLPALQPSTSVSN